MQTSTMDVARTDPTSLISANFYRDARRLTRCGYTAASQSRPSPRGRAWILQARPITNDDFTLSRKLDALPPSLLTGGMISPYRSVATPSGTTGLGAMLALVLIAVI